MFGQSEKSVPTFEKITVSLILRDGNDNPPGSWTIRESVGIQIGNLTNIHCTHYIPVVDYSILSFVFFFLPTIIILIDTVLVLIIIVYIIIIIVYIFLIYFFLGFC